LFRKKLSARARAHKLQ